MEGMSLEEAGRPSRKRGRPRIDVTEEVLERRRLAKQRANAKRPKSQLSPVDPQKSPGKTCFFQAGTGDGTSRKRGRPRLILTEELLEQRRLSKQRSNACRSRRKKGSQGSQEALEQGVDPGHGGGDIGQGTSQMLGTVMLEQRENIELGNLGMEHSPAVEPPTRKRGRPRVVVTDEVLERRRLSRQITNARRSKGKNLLAQSGTGTSGKRRRIGRTASGQCREPQAEASHERESRQGAAMAAGQVEQGPELCQETHNEASQGSENHLDSGHATGPSVEETVRMRRAADRKRTEFKACTTILDIGRQEEACGSCGAQVWPAEFTGRHGGAGPRSYSICCGKGKVLLPALRPPPPELHELISLDSARSKLYFDKSRIYNNLFAFCSFGGNVDHSVNTGTGPYVFRVSGRTYHNFGSLLPPEGQSPKYAQLYMYDAQEALNHRIKFPGKRGEVDPEIVHLLQEMVIRENCLANIFRQTRDRFPDLKTAPVSLRLLERRTNDGRYENLPTENDYEFAGLVVDDDFANKRDIVADSKKTGLRHISELHPSFMSLQYPLLFPYGEDGYRTNIKHRNATDSRSGKNETVSMREYYAYRTQWRPDEGHALLLGGRLFLQFLVDAWCSVERMRLQWVYKHQSLIRSDLYNNIVDSLRHGDVDATDVGRRIVLPSSFTGGYRYMQQNFQDSLALCKEYGHPDLFITFTCNPKWDEIQASIRSSGSHDASVRPDLVARVFKMKLDALMNDLTKKNVLGRVIADVYTVEFQKRGLPHAHIVLWLAQTDKLLTPDDIDNIICAEIPDEHDDPAAYKAVSQFMMHGPCGAANPKCPCMRNNRCTKHYPKNFSDNTTVGTDGYAVYRRRDTKRTVECNNIHLDNRHVVPYHRGLIVKYQAHINVEWCNRSLSIKYLFKYIGKGPDKATIVLQETNPQVPSDEGSSTTLRGQGRDEVKNYLSCRYVSAAESCWRLFEFPIHHRDPFVQRLYFHLENEQEVRFRDNETLPEVVRRVDPDGTMFIQWMLNNRYDDLGRDLTFLKYPTKYRWDSSARRWFRRKQNINVVGRMVYAHPASGERFYMRLLLNIVVGAQNFEDIRTVDGIVYSTYKEACFHRGLLESDNEWHIALRDASLHAVPSLLRDLFVTLLVFCEVANPGELWATHWINLAEDIEYNRRKRSNLPTLRLSDDAKQMLALELVEQLLKQFGKKLTDYPGLPELNISSTAKYKNDLLLEEMMYDRASLRLKANEQLQCLNKMQRLIFDEVVEHVELNKGGFYFVYGPGGTGKTFLWSAIISRLRGEGKIVLAVASSGIASLLVEGGRTAHSRFKIPIDVNEYSCCAIKQNTYLAELLCNTDLVIWDEAPMTHRFVFEAVDRTFRDIRSKVNPNAKSSPFGGLTMLLGGDFRQILPVIPKKGREEIVSATISKSYLWQFCKVFTLVENMRVEQNVPHVTVRGANIHFRDWVLSLGDGREETTSIGDDLERTWIRLPEEVHVRYTGDPVEAVINEIYSDLHHMNCDVNYLRDRAILTPLNEQVECVNVAVLQKLAGQLKTYTSCDTICKGSSDTDTDAVLYPPEFLNSLKCSGLPNHELQAAEEHGMGPRGSALICGCTSYQRQLESCLPELKQKEVSN